MALNESRLIGVVLTHTKNLFVSIIITYFCFSQAQAAPPDYSVILPKASKSLLLDIARAGERLVAVGERGHILYSDNKGNSWQQAKVPTLQMLTAVTFVNSKDGWAVGHDGLVLQTSDGGENWVVQYDGLEKQKKKNIENTLSIRERIDSLKAAMNSNSDDSVIQDLEEQLEEAKLDLEDAESVMKEAVNTPPFMDVLFTSSKDGWVVGAFGQFIHTRDGGQSWQDYSSRLDNLDELHLNALAAGGAGEIFIVGEAAMNFRSLDGGENWQAGNLPYDGSLFSLVGDADASRLMTFGLRGNTFISVDKGLNWEQVDAATDTTLNGAWLAANGEIVAVGSGGLVAHAKGMEKPFASFKRSDRLGLSSVIKIGKSKYVAAGMGGIHQITIQDETNQAASGS